MKKRLFISIFLLLNLYGTTDIFEETDPESVPPHLQVLEIANILIKSVPLPRRASLQTTLEEVRECELNIYILEEALSLLNRAPTEEQVSDPRFEERRKMVNDQLIMTLLRFRTRLKPE